MQASIQAQLQQQAILEQMELRRRARTMVVPTDDAQVRQMLRGMGKPITLFGEGKVSSSVTSAAQKCTVTSQAAVCSQSGGTGYGTCWRPWTMMTWTTLWPALLSRWSQSGLTDQSCFTPRARLRSEQPACRCAGVSAAMQLLKHDWADVSGLHADSALFLAPSSRQAGAGQAAAAESRRGRCGRAAAGARGLQVLHTDLAAARLSLYILHAHSAAFASSPRRHATHACRSLSNLSSELGDERPLATCAFRPDGSQLAVGSWSGLVKLWVMPDCAQPSAFRAHDDRITGALAAA